MAVKPQLVKITVDGKVVQIEPGLLTFQELVSATGSNPKTSKFTIVSTPTPPSAINGNDSYTIQGGEVITTTHG